MSFSLRVVRDQCFTPWSSASLRRKLPKLYARANSCSRTWLSTKSWQESRVHFTAFGVANYSILAVMDILAATDAQTVNGVLYNGDQLLRNLANMVYDGINNSGDIG